MQQEEIAHRIALISNDREHGSRWLVRETLLLLRDQAQGSYIPQGERMKQIQSIGQKLLQARPAMAAIAGAVGRVLFDASDPAAIVHNIERLLTEYEHAPQQIADHARPYMHGQLLTCSISGTLLEVLTELRDQIEGIIALEGRPRYEGRETARILSQQGLPVTLITDAQADIFLPGCQAVVVGADTVLANGDVLNKAGTALLAWAAQGHHLPFYVLCESLKISSRQWPEQESANLALLEEKEPEEVLEKAISGVRVRNFYFDHTPHHLIAGLITELGVLNPSAIAEVSRRSASNILP